MSELISTRIDKKTSDEINKLAKEKNLGKTIILREAISKGLEDLKLEFAIKLYKKGKVTIWKASEIAQISLWEFMDIVKKEKIPMKYTLEDAEEDFKKVFGHDNK